MDKILIVLLLIIPMECYAGPTTWICSWFNSALSEQSEDTRKPVGKIIENPIVQLDKSSLINEIRQYRKIDSDFLKNITPLLEQMSKEELEELMMEVSIFYNKINWSDRFAADIQGRELLRWNNVIIRTYQSKQFIPEYKTIGDLFANGILRIDSSGVVVSDYAFQGNKLNTIVFQSRAENEVAILQNFGTHYSAGSGAEGISTAWGYSRAPMAVTDWTLDGINNEFDVIVGHPVGIVEKYYGDTVKELHEIAIDHRIYQSSPLGRIFSFRPDLTSPEFQWGFKYALRNYCREHGCTIAKPHY